MCLILLTVPKKTFDYHQMSFLACMLSQHFSRIYGEVWWFPTRAAVSPQNTAACSRAKVYTTTCGTSQLFIQSAKKTKTKITWSDELHVPAALWNHKGDQESSKRECRKGYQNKRKTEEARQSDGEGWRRLQRTQTKEQADYRTTAELGEAGDWHRFGGRKNWRNDTLGRTRTETEERLKLHPEPGMSGRTQSSGIQPYSSSPRQVSFSEGRLPSIPACQIITAFQCGLGTKCLDTML